MARHIYLHIPFCAAKCPYCDFYSESGRDGLSMSKVIDGMVSEIDSITTDDVIETVYIGGGTPSVIDAELIAKLIDSVRNRFTLSSDCEITMEVNPSSMTLAKARTYRKAGINRVSVGVQSLNDDVLKTLGRLHDRAGAMECLRMVRDEITPNISADLMIAIPGQTMEDISNAIDILASEGVKHISTYSLTLEEGTVFYSRYKDTIEDLVSPETEREMYHMTRKLLPSRGYIPYEISNSAIPGYESRHNSSYWEGEEYYGIGSGSHGYVDGVRYCHENSIDGYITDPLSTTVEEVLSEEDRMKEYPFLKLRTAEGMDKGEFYRRFGKDICAVFKDALSKNIVNGLVEDTGDHIRLTDRGLDWYNRIAEDFL